MGVGRDFVEDLVGGLRPDEASRVLVPVGEPDPDVAFEGLDEAVDPLAQASSVCSANHRSTRVQPRSTGRCAVQMEAWLGQPAAHRLTSGVLRVAYLSRMRWTSRPAGTALSTLARNLSNPAARWRRWSYPITLPLATSSAAKNVVLRAPT